MMRSSTNVIAVLLILSKIVLGITIPDGARYQPSGFGHTEPSILVAPETQEEIRRNGRPYEFKCEMVRGKLRVSLPEGVDLLSELTFTYFVPWNETLDPRVKGDAYPTDLKYQRYREHVFKGSEKTVTLPETPFKSRVAVTVYADTKQPYWPSTNKGCWTGRRVKAPGPISEITTYELGKLAVIFKLPIQPNGPIDGFMIWFCPLSGEKGSEECAPEDRLVEYELLSLDSTYSTFLYRDEEDTEYKLCAAAYNLLYTERLLGPRICTIVKPPQKEEH